MDEELGVELGGDQRALGLQFPPQLVSVLDIAVVGEGKPSIRGVGDEGLNVLLESDGGVAAMTYRSGALHVLDLVKWEAFGDEAHALLDMERPVGSCRGDPGGLLTAVLEFEQRSVHQRGRAVHAVDGDHPAVLAELVEGDGDQSPPPE
jgi:hypothetical protein